MRGQAQGIGDPVQQAQHDGQHADREARPRLATAMASGSPLPRYPLHEPFSRCQFVDTVNHGPGGFNGAEKRVYIDVVSFDGEIHPKGLHINFGDGDIHSYRPGRNRSPSLSR